MQDLKDFIKRVFRTPMLLVFAIICVTLLPPAINKRSLAFRTGIVVAMGIDTDVDNNFILDAIITVPSVDDTLSESDKIISSKGATFFDALANMTILFGRAIRLGHIRYIVIGPNISRQNVAKALDGVIRTNKVRDSVQLVLCEDGVHEIFNSGVELKSKTGLRISDIVCHNDESSTILLDSNVDSFYKGYFGETKISRINCISLTSDHEEGITNEADVGGKSGGDTESGAGQENGKKNMYVSNEGKIAVYRDGKLSAVLPKDISMAMGWIDANYLPKKLIVETRSISDIDYISFEVLNKNVRMESFFLKDIPIISVKIGLTLDVNEIININSDIVPRSRNIIQTEIKTDAASEIRKQVGYALDYSKQLKLDFLKFNEIFSLKNNKGYTQYMKNGKTIEEFLENVMLNIEVNVSIV